MLGVAVLALVLLVATRYVVAGTRGASDRAQQEAFGPVWSSEQTLPRDAAVTVGGGQVFVAALTADSTETTSAIFAERRAPTTGLVEVTRTVVPAGAVIADGAWRVAAGSSDSLFVLWKRAGTIAAERLDGSLALASESTVTLSVDSTATASWALDRVVADGAGGAFVSLTPTGVGASTLNRVDGDGRRAEAAPGLPMPGDGTILGLATSGATAYVLLGSAGAQGDAGPAIVKYSADPATGLKSDWAPVRLDGREASPAAALTSAGLLADGSGVWVCWRDAKGQRLQRVSKAGALTWGDAPKQFSEAGAAALASDGRQGAYLVSSERDKIIVRHFGDDGKAVGDDWNLASGVSAAVLRGAVGDMAGDLSVGVSAGGRANAMLVRADSRGALVVGPLSVGGPLWGEAPVLDDGMGGAYVVFGSAAASKLARFSLKDPPLSCGVVKPTAMKDRYDLTLEVRPEADVGSKRLRSQTGRPGFLDRGARESTGRGRAPATRRLPLSGTLSQ